MQLKKRECTFCTIAGATTTKPRNNLMVCTENFKEGFSNLKVTSENVLNL